jgi:hypothetical protein
MTWQKIFKFWNKVLPLISIGIIFLAGFYEKATRWMFLALLVLALPSAVYNYLTKKSLMNLLMLIALMVLMICLIFNQFNFVLTILNCAFVVGIIYWIYKLFKRFK